ncbi:MAG: DUF4870 domain-containing protein [Candidatus Omnitrophota bacterium]|nr:MAG: DUF4870 domain-containing protein [Candidatus Omnitrophota bacterium]
MAEMDQKQERTWAMFCHLGALIGIFLSVAFAHIIAPLVIWLLKKDESALIDAEGKKSLNFQISITIYGIISFILCFVFIGFLLLAALGIFDLIMVIIATVKVNKGEKFNYPLSIQFIK